METIRCENGAVTILDQTKLPVDEQWIAIDTPEQMAEAICALRVRGAPLIGVSAAYGAAISARTHLGEDGFLEKVQRDIALLRGTRPTAVNLFWALDQAERRLTERFAQGGGQGAVEGLFQLAHALREQDGEINRRMGAYGAELLKDGDGVLTHCNAGALATCGHGTALGVIRSAVEMGKKITVYADETRPLLQGARLTAWELQQDGIEVVVLCDNMAASLMRTGKVQRVIVGADRIAANGDAANKIGSYGVALWAKAHNIPFYVAAPVSTIDASLESGEQIPIEHRSGSEVRTLGGVVTAPDVPAYNPAFDVVPAGLIDAIVTEHGVLRPPFGQAIAKLPGR